MSSLRPVFLLSLPRSGSTLLQRMLSTHSAVSTTPEPWFLLPLVGASNSVETFSEYNHAVMRTAVREFAEGLQGGQATFDSLLHDYSMALYEKASDRDAKYFLDKTPRYYLIATRLREIFPNAKFILLWRHPLAIVTSMVTTWSDNRWRLDGSKIDLYQGLENLVQFCDSSADNLMIVRYEELVADPEGSGVRLAKYLELDYRGFDFANLQSLRSSRMGDPVGQKLSGVLRTTDSKWKSLVTTSIRKRWCRNYLRWIGPDRLTTMGYCYEQCLKELDELEVSIVGSLRDLRDISIGQAMSILEPSLIRNKLSKFPHLHNLHPHR